MSHLRLVDASERGDVRDREELVNLEAEQGLLATILRFNESLASVSYLKPEHFTDPLHSRIYDACARMIASGQRADPITLKGVFDHDPGLVNIGGAKYLRGLYAAAFPPSCAEDFAGIVLDLARKRALLDIAKDLRAAALDPERTADVVAAETAATIAGAIGPRAKSGGGSARDLALEVVALAEGTAVVYSTGLPGLDAAMGGGLMPGLTYGFRAATKAGKSTLAGTIADNLNAAGVPSLYLAFEMKPRQIARRNLARALGVNGMALLPGANAPLLARAASVALTTPEAAYYEPMAGRTLEDTKQTIAEHIPSRGIKGVFVDYIQLIQGQERHETQAGFLERAANDLVAFCARHDLWLVLLAQVNKEGETRGSVGLNMAADQLYTLHREHGSRMAALKMELTRDTAYRHVGVVDDNGVVTSAGLFFESEGPHFVDAGDEDEQEQML